jgi:hypothetical protein
VIASVTGSVESACDVVQEAFARALRDQNSSAARVAWGVGVADRLPGSVGSKGSARLVVDEVPEVAFADQAVT